MKPEIEMKGKKLVISKVLEKEETYKINNTKKTFSVIVYKKPKMVTGVTSMCRDSTHILMLDYDDICKWIVLRDLNFLTKEYGLAPFYLFTTKEATVEGNTVGNYHAICLQKFLPHDIVRFQQLTHCDNAYRTMPLRNIFRSWVIRTSMKDKRNRPEYLCYVDGSKENLISSAHHALLRKLYDLPDVKYKLQDGFKKVYRNVYETGNY